MCEDYEIREMPLTLKSVRNQVEAFLACNGLRLENVDEYVAVFAIGEDAILAGGGLAGNTIKCVAVGDTLRGTGMGTKLISHLVCVAASKGYDHQKVFTKPENQMVFTSLGFNMLAASPQAIFLENSTELNTYCTELQTLQTAGKCGIIVMNANPFTHGHHYLVEQAAQQVDHLFVMVVHEDKSRFSYAERLTMVRQGCAGLGNVTVCSGSRYAVSSDTFPTYFLKQIDDATDEQILLDLDLFARHLAPALGVTIRFVGSEPTDALTRRYNQLMHKTLPGRGIAVVEIDRQVIPGADGQQVCDKSISASLLRHYLDDRRFLAAADLAYHTTIPYLIAELAECALLDELNTTPKPGLVDRLDNGAHDDMNYQMMYRSIKVLRPYFVQLAQCGLQCDLPSFGAINNIGLQAEQAMYQSTYGVNTYKGALFSMGLAIVAAAHTYYNMHTIDHKTLRRDIASLAAQFPVARGTHGEMVMARHDIAGARDCACQAYPLLFEQWLPFFDRHASDPNQFHKTLLLIMSTLDDTNLYYRGGRQAVGRIKVLAADLLKNYSLEGMQLLNQQMIRDHLSPGGSADMLSLTAFIHSLR